MTFSYSNDQEAARGLLIETAALLNCSGIDYAIIGGWLPYLFNTMTLKHPGTFDVDVLLNERMREKQVVAALDSFKSSGFRRAAKNTFQLFRTLRVGGEDVDFHVDFLHRKYASGAEDSIEMMWGPYTTIAGPGSDIVFKYNERFVSEVLGDHPTLGSQSVNVTFCSEIGLLSTKGRSISFGKRTRDAYDVFLAIKESRDRAKLVRRVRELRSDLVFLKSIKRLEVEFRTGSAMDDACNHYGAANSISPRDARLDVERTMMQFFEDTISEQE